MTKIKVIKDAYYVNEDVSGLGLIDKDTFECSFSHLLVTGDVWEKRTMDDGYEFFECTSGKWEGEESDGYWEYNYVKGYFEVIE
jgi:hypothetical protein